MLILVAVNVYVKYFKNLFHQLFYSKVKKIIYQLLL